MNGNSIPAHKLFISRSDQLLELVQNSVKKNGNRTLVDLTDVDADAVEFLIRHLYTDCLKGIIHDTKFGKWNSRY